MAKRFGDTYRLENRWIPQGTHNRRVAASGRCVVSEIESHGSGGEVVCNRFRKKKPDRREKSGIPAAKPSLDELFRRVACRVE